MSEIIRFERLQQAATEPVTTKAPLDVSSDSNQDDIQMESLQDDMLDLQLDLEEAGEILIQLEINDAREFTRFRSYWPR